MTDSTITACLLVAALISTISASPTSKESGAAGEVIMAGGYNEDDQWLSSVEVIGGDPLPAMPVEDCCNTLTAVGPVLYSCGGNNKTGRSADCYSLDTSAETPQWNFALQLPATMCAQTAVAIGSHIWIVSEGVLYDIDTETNDLTSMQTAFHVTSDHCAVSNGTHSYLIGVGSDRTEIWLNSKESDSSEWEKIFNLPVMREASGCLLVDDTIIIAGGDQIGTKVDIYSIEHNAVTATGDLNTSRNHLQMCFIDGQPAVVGGYDHDNDAYLSSIETYDAASDTWTTSTQTLEKPKFSFGLSQNSEMV